MTRADNTRPQVQAIRSFSRSRFSVARLVSLFTMFTPFCCSHCQYSSSFHIVNSFLQLFFTVQNDGFYPFHRASVSHCQSGLSSQLRQIDWGSRVSFWEISQKREYLKNVSCA